MPAEKKDAYDPEAYWAKRYSSIDISRSGHIDLPLRYNYWLYRRKKDRLLQGLRRAGFREQGASVLDIAAGTGVYVELWQALGIRRLVGIDISAAATDALQTRFPEYAFHKRDLAAPNLRDTVGSEFDLATAVDMLYHVVDDANFAIALSNISSVLKPGGLLAIHDMFLHRSELDFGYIKLRTLKAYQTALDAAGFDILWRAPTFFATVQCHDFKTAWAESLSDAFWSRFTSPLIHRFPDAMGRFGYAVDRMLGSVLSEGPSFEMMICRKRIG